MFTQKVQINWTTYKARLQETPTQSVRSFLRLVTFVLECIMNMLLSGIIYSA